MSKKQPTSIKFVSTQTLDKSTGRELPLPGLLSGATRAATSVVDPLLAGITVEKVYSLTAPSRGAPAGQEETLKTAKAELLAVEAEDGTTLLIRSDTLADAVKRVRPEAVVGDVVDFAEFRDPNATARGMGDIFWKAVSVLSLPKDALLNEARELALEWARDKLGSKVDDKAYEVGSVLGTKALMWKIESRLAGRPGLYCWHDKTMSPGDLCLAGDPRLPATDKPMLVMIHGTGSYTLGSFSDLREDEETWKELTQRFPGGIFGFEHRTFSESPMENALELLEALPDGARISLLTHSRGGLVGDLLCLGQVKDDVINAYRIKTDDLADREPLTAEARQGLEAEAVEERQRLRAIRDELVQKKLSIERYVRVACPARGTRLLSENLDVALSNFLNVLQKGGGALVGAVATSMGGPAAGEAFGQGASSCLGVVKRLVLEIADKRMDPRLVPGIAAMRTDSPLAIFLAHPDTPRRDGIQMAVIAGDTEFEGLGFSNFQRRVANLFCDWKLFDHADNDLVVDTDSMYAGLGFRDGARYLYDQDASVTHFRYFCNPPTRDALRGWLAESDLGTLTQFRPLNTGDKIPWKDREALAVRRGVEAGPKPVVILIPGIMGSHIEINRKRPAEPGSGDRIWFSLPNLIAGKLDRIGNPGDAKVMPQDLFEMFYGKLADYLADTHVVIRCPYDWRKPVKDCAEDLKARIDQAAQDYKGQPIRLLAHSMGGLVTRALMQEHAESWKTVVDSGGSLVMLGTPNNGSHLMVHSLLGKSDSMRKLATIDVVHNLQQVLDIVAGFPGALALLPRPGFADAGRVPRVIDTSQYYGAAIWGTLKNLNADRWFGDRICGIPNKDLLGDTQNAWNELPVALPKGAEKVVSYVFGQSDKTPCGAKIDDGKLNLLFTADGDGSVTWASGRFQDMVDERCWYMPVEHGDLAGTEEYFPGIVDLLQKGATDKLGRVPRARGEEAPSFVLEAPPPVVPNEEELARAFMGSGPRRRVSSRTTQVLRVSVWAGDLRFLDQPVMCGHYIGDAISGAEAALDDMLNGALSERERLGVYANELGTSAIVLRRPGDEERARGSRPGAVIVGLGHFTGQLSTGQLTETVRAAVLRLLLQLCESADAAANQTEQKVQLYSQLIGCSSTAGISVAESVAAITRGVLEANHQFCEIAKGRIRDQVLLVTDLCFSEMYRDAAITATHAVQDLPDHLEGELKRLRARIEPGASLAEGDGVMDRLCAAADLGHWSRLIVTDADASELDCAPECYEEHCTSPIPPEVQRRLREKPCPDKETGEPSTATETEANAEPDKAPADQAGDASPTASRYYPQRLKYVFLSPRARAETTWQQRQPGLVEAIISTQMRSPVYNAKLGYTLFQLMVPLDYKPAAREQSRLLMVLDGYTANLPWELLQAEGDPMVLSIPMVRQLATSRYRATVRTANTNVACIIVSPNTYGFDKRFPSPPELAELPGATREGEAIRSSLRNAGWSETNIAYCPEGKDALDILCQLYERPYRVLMIAAHGIFEAKARDGRSYTGVVLSDGLLITAVEVGQMEVVPDVVFLSCCHLGSINTLSEPNRFAYSLARELIEMGVRCVVAAGWAVDDDAACTFAGAFFDQMTKGETFGDAIFAARKLAARQHPGSNTWGAYQAYGDPGYRLRPTRDGEDGARDRPYVAVEELLAALHGQRVRNKRRKNDANPPKYADQGPWVQRQLARCPPDWAEMPDMLQAIAELYAEFGAEGFDAAREAYQRAVQLEDKAGRVALRAIEQLANMEARYGGKKADQGDIDQGVKLIDSAINRLLALADSVCGEDKQEMNCERAALLGSAYKLKAAALARKEGARWEGILPTVNLAAKAYESAVRGDPALSPYNTLNVLALARLSAVLGEADEKAAALALRCGEQARRKFVSSKDFWDAVMSADAALTAWLLGMHLDDPLKNLKGRYEDAVALVPQSSRQWDSVVKQWRLLADFLKLKGEGTEQADVLNSLADQYVPRAAAPKPSTTASDKEGATPNVGKAKTTRKPASSTRKKR
ncbi:MAG: CHAT domain-containing protein [Thiobacillaceae bacterium]